MKTIINKLVILLIITSCGEKQESIQEKNKEFMLNEITKVIANDSTLFIVNNGTKYKISMLENKILRLTTLDSFENKNKFYTFDSSGMLSSGIIENGYLNGKVNYYKNGFDLRQIEWYDNNKFFFGQRINNDNSMVANYDDIIGENIDTSKLQLPIIKSIITGENENYIEIRVNNYPIQMIGHYYSNIKIEKYEYNFFNNIIYAYYDKKNVGKSIKIKLEFKNSNLKTIKSFMSTIELK